MPRQFLLPAAALALAIAWAGLTSLETMPGPREAASNRPIQQSEDGYTSSDACQACHPSQYATWHRSYHRTMTQVASSSTVRADFAGVQVDAVHGRPMRLTRNGERFFAEFDDPDWSGAEGAGPRISREVVMITGSHHQQIYWYATGRDRLLGQLPGAYLIAERQWIPRRTAVLHPPSDPVFSETGHWNAVCIACHTTSGKPEFDTPFGSVPVESQTMQSRVAEFGIACEACHGPGEAHIAANRNPARRYRQHFGDAADETTTQPMRLAANVSSQVCGQCHGIWEFSTPADERLANSRGLPYRPGAELTATRFLAQPTRNADTPAMHRLLEEDPNFIRDSFWPDGMVRVTGREYNGLIESPCFVNATDESRKLTCFSCHTMHKTPDDARAVGEWANDQLGPGKDDNRACASCHQPIAATAESLTAHTGHQAASEGSACYNCHMPYTTYGLLKTIRSHTVSSPSVAESQESGRPNACNLCHLDKSLAWTAEALEARKVGRARQAGQVGQVGRVGQAGQAGERLRPSRAEDVQIRSEGSASVRAGGGAPAQVSDDDAHLSAAVLWALKGDAGQRAIVAQAMGWKPAQQISGTAWMTPILAQLLDDPYDAVRFIAARSLRSTPGFQSFPYDFVAPQKDRYASQLAAMRVWDGAGRGTSVPPASRTALLLGPDGALRVSEMLRILKERNDRPVLLRE